mgnify:CR=1 FL=1
MTVIVLVLIIFFIFLAMRVPIGTSMAIASIIGFISIDFNLATVGSVVYTAVSNQSLMCIPGYILAGALMSRGGIAKALIDCLKGWLGHIPGSLAIITTICCAFFAAITGSSTATVAAIGGLMMPAMLEDGYDENMTLGLTAASGTLGILIPPSIPMVLYCTVAGTAVSKQFTAGLLPGLVIVFAYSVYSVIKSKKTQKGVTQRASMKERWQRTVYAIPAILLPVTILGSIYGGVMTATEASVWAIFYALVISIFVYKGFTLQDFVKCIKSSIRSTSSIFFIIVGCQMFSLLLTTKRVPQTLMQWALANNLTTTEVILACMLLMIVTGMFLDGSSNMLICAPLMCPIVSALGYNMIQFGIVLTIGVQFGQLTPPVGMNLFMVSGMMKRPVMKVVRGALPYIAILGIVWLLVGFVQPVSMLLPDMMK